MSGVIEHVKWFFFPFFLPRMKIFRLFFWLVEPGQPCLPLNEIVAFFANNSPPDADSIWNQTTGDCLESSLMKDPVPAYSPPVADRLWSILFIGSVMAAVDELNLLRYSLVFANVCLRYEEEIESMISIHFGTTWDRRFEFVDWSVDMGDIRTRRLTWLLTPYWNLDSVCPGLVLANSKIFRMVSLERIFRAEFIVEERDVYRMTANVSRENILESSSEIFDDFFLYLWETGQVGGLFVRFEDEDGIDQGGVFVDWVTSVGQALVKEEFVIPTEEGGNAFTVNVSKEIPEKYLKLIGIVLGLALLHDTHIGIPISVGLFKFLLNERVVFEDLKFEYPELYRNLNTFDPNSVEADFGEMIYGGSNVLVTKDNLMIFHRLMAEWKLLKSAENQLNSIRSGFELILGLNFRDKFSPSIQSSLMRGLICGNSREPSAEEFLENVLYDFQLIDPNHGIRIQSEFEELIIKLSSQTRLGDLLAFITGNRIVDFRPINIVWLAVHDPDSRFPSVSTCTRSLKLPLYTSTDVLETRITLALNDAGSREFGLY